jgi:amino-acid N-acetyltransferase
VLRSGRASGTDAAVDAPTLGGLLRMNGAPWAAETATAGDRLAVVALLDAAGLPTSDLGAASDLRLRVVRDRGRVVGAIGLERFGTSGLLRSLVVAPEMRGRGLGGVLVDAVERDARSAGLDALVLLTQTAEPFFAARGYARIERAAAPEAVKTSAEFASLCPASAVTMIKPLDGTR